MTVLSEAGNVCVAIFCQSKCAKKPWPLPPLAACWRQYSQSVLICFRPVRSGGMWLISYEPSNKASAAWVANNRCTAAAYWWLLLGTAQPLQKLSAQDTTPIISAGPGTHAIKTDRQWSRLIHCVMSCSTTSQDKVTLCFGAESTSILAPFVEAPPTHPTHSTPPHPGTRHPYRK